jgi:hypothetical protein
MCQTIGEEEAGEESCGSLNWRGEWSVFVLSVLVCTLAADACDKDTTCKIRLLSFSGGCAFYV